MRVFCASGFLLLHLVWFCLHLVVIVVKFVIRLDEFFFIIFLFIFLFLFYIWRYGLRFLFPVLIFYI